MWFYVLLPVMVGIDIGVTVVLVRKARRDGYYEGCRQGMPGPPGPQGPAGVTVGSRLAFVRVGKPLDQTARDERIAAQFPIEVAPPLPYTVADTPPRKHWGSDVLDLI